MILGQLRMWACQTKNAPLLRIALIRAGRAQRPPNFKMVIECSNMLSPPSLRFRALARKLQKCCFFENQFWAHRLTLSRYNLETETWEPKPYTCSESWVCKDSVGTSPKNSRLKFWVWSVSPKHSLSNKFPCNNGEKSIEAHLPNSPIKPNTPKFSGVGLKLSWCHRLDVQGLSKSGNSDPCTQK